MYIVLWLFFISKVLNRFIVSFFDDCRRAECVLKAAPPVDWWMLLCCSGLACTSNAALAVRADNVYSRISFSSFFFTPPPPPLFLFFPPYPQQMSVTSASRRTPAHAIQVQHYLCVCVCVWVCVCARINFLFFRCGFFNQHRCLSAHAE